MEINKSLSALGDVIQALTQDGDHQHVPYRNHKLTTILQDAIGGNAKTLMFVNCSPASSCIDETLMSLQWATRVNKISNQRISELSKVAKSSDQTVAESSDQTVA